MTREDFLGAALLTKFKSSKNGHRYIKISPTQYRVIDGITGMPDDDPRWDGIKDALGYDGTPIGTYDIEYLDGMGLLYLEFDEPFAYN
jgi:hypothetical protein